MTILDDARDGMDPQIRPQDDLFGHVNGQWLATAEIPVRPGQLGCLQRAGRAGRAGRARHRRGVRRRRGRRRARHADTADRPPVAFLHGRGPRRGARRRTGRRRPRRRRCRQRPRGAGDLHRRARAPGGRRLLRRLRRHRRPQLRPLRRQPAAGRPGAAGRVLLPRAEVRRDPRGLRRLPRAHLHPRGRPLPGRPRAGGGTRDGSGDQDRGGPLGARRHPRRHQGLQPDDLRRGAPARSGVRLGRLRRRDRCRRADARRGGRAAAQLLRAPVETPGRLRAGGLEGVGVGEGAARRRVVPELGLRGGQLRLLRPHAVGHAGAAGTVEARRRVRRGLRRRGGRPALRRATLPARQQGGDGRPRRATCWRPTGAASPPWTG